MNIQELRQHFAAGTITEREYDVLQLRIRGLSQNVVALALDISRSTVRSTEKNAHRKIERHDRKAAA